MYLQTELTEGLYPYLSFRVEDTKVTVMKRLSALAMLTSVLNAPVQGQELLFDEPHLEDRAIHMVVRDGKEVVVNSSGQVIDLHPVFLRPEHQRKSEGLTVGISSPEHAQMKANGSIGPTFNLTYVDVANSNGQGFDHPTEGAKRRAALEAAFAYFASSMTDIGSADIEIRASFSGNPNSNPFAFSGAYYYGSRGFNDPFTVRHITTGNDPHGTFPDAYIQFNFHSGMNFNFDVNAEPASDQYDFFTVALHEIMHVLGFASYCNAVGESAASPNIFTSYDGRLVDYLKNPLFELMGSGNTAYVTKPAQGLLTNNQLWFEPSPGRLFPVFSPSSFNSSSISHFDNSRTTHGGYVMHPSLNRGKKFAHLHEEEVEVLQLLGYGMDISFATSIGDHSDHGPVSSGFSNLYPNPVERGQAVLINAPATDESEILVIVYDMMGREAYSKVMLTPGAGPLTAIDPHHNLRPGMYLVIGSSRHELFNQKLVIR